MTRIIEIQKMAVTSDQVDGAPFHESMMRAYNILAQVKDLLERGTPASVILELITEMESSQKD